MFLLLTGAIYQVTRENTQGTDFYIYYAAGQNVTLYHQSPYDDSVGQRSQMAILKHPALSSEDQLRYVYPPYGLIPVLPLTGLPFPWAQAAWMAVAVIAIPSVILYGFRKASPWFLASLFLLYPLTFGLLLGNLNMPVIGILFLLAGRIPQIGKQQRIESCILGFLMALATIKPQFSVFFIFFFLLVGIKNKNILFLISFLAGIVFVLAFSFILIPDWIPQWLGLIHRYPSYIGGKIPITPLIDQFFPSGQAVAYAILGISIFLLVAWFVVRWWNEKISSLVLLAVGGFATYFFNPTGLSYDQMIFLIPVILWILQGWQRRPFLFGIFWLLIIACSWIFLYLSLSQIWPAGTYFGLYLLYGLWLLFGVFVTPRFLQQGNNP